MAKKSKTQRAKASARRQEKKATAQRELENPTTDEESASKEEPAKKSFFKKSEDKPAPTPAAKKAADKPKPKPKPKAKKGLFKFFYDVKAEMKRVTWPTRQDVLQWSGVVIVALVFFGVYVAILDSGIITPLLIAFSSLGA